MRATVARWTRLHPGIDRLWWLLPVAATAFVVRRLWDVTDLARIDFRIYVDAVHSWQSGSIYDYGYPDVGLGFTYPPFAGLLLRPVAALPYELAEHGWLLATALASLAFLVLAGRRLPVRPTWAPTVPIVTAVLMLTTPVWLTLRMGQINAYLALLVLADVVLVRRRIAGVLIGLGGAIKLTPLYAVLFFVAARRWRSVVIAGATFAAATLLAWVWMPSDSVRYWTVELLATDRVGDLGDVFNNSLRRLIAMLPISSGLATALWLAAAVGVTAFAVVRARQAIDRDNPLAAITVIMCASFVVAPISWSHHLYFMLPAVLLLIGSGASMARNIAAATLSFVLLETHDPGEDPTTTAWRAVALVLIVLFLPLDQGARVDQDDASGATDEVGSASAA